MNEPIDVPRELYWIKITRYILLAISLILLGYLIVRQRCKSLTNPWVIVLTAILLGILFFSAFCGASFCGKHMHTKVLQPCAEKPIGLWLLFGGLLGTALGVAAAGVIWAIVRKNCKKEI